MVNALVHELRLFWVAVQFLTRVPVPRWVGYDPAWLNHCVRPFPLVGAMVGGFGALVWWGASLAWPPVVAVLLSMAATIWLTGGFHEDGLTDTIDALGGTVSRDKALVIMKDSRIGAYGAMGLFLVLGLKAATLVALAAHGVLWPALALMWAHGVSRAMAVVLMWVLPYAGGIEHAKVKPLSTSVVSADLLVSLGWLLLLSVAMMAAVRAWVPGMSLTGPVLLGGLFCLVVTWVCGRWFLHRLGGYTGDALGATQQFSEVAALMAWLAVLNHPELLGV